MAKHETVLFWRRRDMLCTSGVVNDVVVMCKTDVYMYVCMYVRIS